MGLWVNQSCFVINYFQHITLLQLRASQIQLDLKVVASLVTLHATLLLEVVVAEHVSSFLHELACRRVLVAVAATVVY